MGTELQHWLSRNRPPRVQITYDVETLGATVKQEIPFIVGVISDLKGGDDPDTPMDERLFVEIDRDSFNTVMEKRVGPALSLTGKTLYTVSRSAAGSMIQPTTAAPTTFSASLVFKTLDDFAPPSIIQQVPELKKLMDTRQSLADLVAKLGTDPTLEGKLAAQAAPLTAAPAKKALTTANTALTTANTGTAALFSAACTAVLKVETADPNKTTVTTAQKAVTDAITKYTPLYTTGITDAATAAAVQSASTALAAVQAALETGTTTLETITSAYPTAGSDDQKAAVAAVKSARASVNTLPPLLWQVGAYCTSMTASPPLPQAS